MTTPPDLDALRKAAHDLPHVPVFADELLWLLDALEQARVDADDWRVAFRLARGRGPG